MASESGDAYNWSGFKIRAYENEARTKIETSKSERYQSMIFGSLMCSLIDLTATKITGKFITYNRQDHTCIQLGDISNYEFNFDESNIPDFNRKSVIIDQPSLICTVLSTGIIKELVNLHCCVKFNYLTYFILYSPKHDSIIFIKKDEMLDFPQDNVNINDKDCRFVMSFINNIKESPVLPPHITDDIINAKLDYKRVNVQEVYQINATILIYTGEIHDEMILVSKIDIRDKFARYDGLINFKYFSTLSGHPVNKFIHQNVVILQALMFENK